jgi:hypothetical protein
MSFFDFIKAAELGAASVYHDILALGVEIVHWASNPAVAPLVEAGVGIANSMLERAGAGDTAKVVVDDVHAALKSIAAADPTVPSMSAIGKLAGLAGDVVSAIKPDLAAPIATAEGFINLAEGMIGTVTQTSTVTTEVKPSL